MKSGFGTSHRSGREQTPDVLPASQYLQEKLQERRARNTRPKKGRQSDLGPRRGADDDLFIREAEQSKQTTARLFDSSPMAPGSRKHADLDASNRRRGLGVKDMDEHMDRLTKQNFALKLELDHRREQTQKLQEQIDSMRSTVERAELMRDEHTELLRINGQLVEELEKRDKAVEEAIDTICDLEDKLERTSATRPSTANADSGYAGTETHEQAPPSSPPEVHKTPKTPTPQAGHREPPPAASAAAGQLFNIVNGLTPAQPRRVPAMLSQKKQSTNALRSVFLETAQSLHPVKSFNSILTRQEGSADDDKALESPRLSVLSESSFPSIYSPKKDVSPDRYAWEAEDEDQPGSPQGLYPHFRQDSIKRVSQWMDQRDRADGTPAKSNGISPPLLQQQKPSPSRRPGDEALYQSLGNAITETSPTAQRATNGAPQPVSYIKPFPIRTDKHLGRSARPSSLAGPIFGEPLLPPTPESASTRMLRGSRSSIADDKSLLDTTPAAVKGYDAMEPGVRTAPKQVRSSVELNTAYDSYIQRRNDLAAGRNDEEDDNDDDDDEDAHSDTVRDLSMDYDGFPDGGSILAGTPSRFLKHGKPPATNMFFDGNNDVSPLQPPRSPHRRQHAASTTTASQRKPQMNRAETSPAMIRTEGLAAPPAQQSIMSPRSFQSGSSSSRTVVHTEKGTREMSPEMSRTDSHPSTSVSFASPPRSRASPSPARTFSQKAQGLFRRMSVSKGDGQTPSDREKSPLPTLTSTPSSAYINDVPKEARRPGTSHSGDISGQAVLRPKSSKDGKRRPSIQARTKTAPSDTRGRPLSSSMGDYTPILDKERKNFFGRGNTPTQGSNGLAQDSNSAPKGMTKRRNSIKDAVGSAARRAWR